MMASQEPRDPVVDAYRSGLDLTLIRENLRRSVEERLRRLIDQQHLAAELRRAPRIAADPQRR
jgi:hypothetical protein